jgi:putative addiction module antidote
MTKQLKLIAIGNSTGVILPKHLLAHLKAKKGDKLTIIATPDGVQLRASDEPFERQMAVAREVMQDRYNALRKLAK